MNKLKRALGLCALLAMGTALSGCVVVPVPFGYYGGHHHYHR